MNTTDAWKIARTKNKRGSPFTTITHFADMTAYDMIQYTKMLRVQDEIPVINDALSIESNPSSLSHVSTKYQ